MYYSMQKLYFILTTTIKIYI